MTYDKSIAKNIDDSWKKVRSTGDWTRFSGSISNGELSQLGKIAMFVKAGDRLSKGEINLGALNNHKKTSYGSYYSFFSINEILEYSTKTRKWSRGSAYDRYVNDLRACEQLEHKLDKLGL